MLMQPVKYFAKPRNVFYKGSPAVYYSHSISTVTILQTIVFAICFGLLALCLKDAWYLMGILAPVLVDFLKPTIIYEAHNEH